MAHVIASQAVNFDQLDVSALVDAPMLSSSPTVVTYGDGGIVVTFEGSFTYRNGALSGGVVTAYKEAVNGQTAVQILDVNVPVPSLLQWAQTGDNLAVRNAFLGGQDLIEGSPQGDFLRGYDGYDSIFGGAGDETIAGGEGGGYLRGGDGNDKIYGGSGFDDIHGNEGWDFGSGMEGDDWVVGGLGNDQLWGGTGNDIVLGNIGGDRCYGDDGDDIIRGGQNEDTLEGGAGNDWLSGDRGSDAIWGGAGADTFHFFYGADVDGIGDFNLAEGDRVILDAGGQSYRIYEENGSTYLSFEWGKHLTLKGVSMASLTGDWLTVI